VVTFIGDVNYTAAVNSTEFGGVLINTTLVINSVPDSKVNSSVNVNGTLKDEYGDNVSGATVIVTVDGFNYTSTTDSNGNWNITYIVNSSSEISVIATFIGDVNYTAAANNTEFAGVLINTTLVINPVPNSKVNSSVNVNGTLKDEYGDNVSGVTVIVTVDGFNYTSTTDSNGNWNITYIVNSSSEISVVATFIGDVNYTAAVNSTEFGGVLINTTLVINSVPDSKVNSSVSVNGTLKDEYGDNVSGVTVIVTVDGFNYTSTTDSNGNWNITYIVNSSSEISVVATFIGDVNYTAAANNTEFGGVLINTTLVINPVPDSKVNSSVSINGTLKDEYGDNVSGVTVIVTVDGFNYTSTTDSNGNWNITYIVNSSSEINVIATFIGDVNYTAAVNNTEFGGVLINTTLVINPVPNSKVNSSVSVNGTLKDEYGDNVSGVTVIVTVDGFNYTSTTDSNGDWNITCIVNSSSEISVVATFVGDVNYTAAVNSTEFGGVLINTTLVINLVPDSKVNSSVSVNGTLKDEYGDNVSGVTVIVTVDGFNYTSTTDDNGDWNITCIVNSSSEISVVATFVGDVNYTAAVNSTEFGGVLINTTLVINLVPDSKVNSSVSVNGT
ncbi:beta strand repeat-containing protein, partial [Methanobrevibacter filiformis]|uniref:beta strand repeat-containing protein n=1 Tax=Methanobrevibacter filiformis TaxID=55758 RepID=UPI0014722403